MNALNPLFIFIAFAVLFTGPSTDAPDTHTITLNVNTGLVGTDNLDETSDFGQDRGVKNKDFTTVVKTGDILIWNGVSSSAPDTDEVQIESIHYEDGDRVFTKDVLTDSDQNPGMVIGTVQGKDGDILKYTVHFKVLNDGVQRGTVYQIDPKIQIRN